MWAGTIPQNRPRSIRRGAARPAARIASESSEARSGWIEREARARPAPKTGHRHGPRRREGQRTLPRAKIPGIRFLRRAPHPCRREAAGAGRDGSAARAGHLAAGGATGHESSPHAVRSREKRSLVAPRCGDWRRRRNPTGGAGEDRRPRVGWRIGGGGAGGRERRSGGRREKRRGGAVRFYFYYFWLLFFFVVLEFMIFNFRGSGTD